MPFGPYAPMEIQFTIAGQTPDVWEPQENYRITRIKASVLKEEGGGAHLFKNGKPCHTGKIPLDVKGAAVDAEVGVATEPEENPAFDFNECTVGLGDQVWAAGDNKDAAGYLVVGLTPLGPTVDQPADPV